MLEYFESVAAGIEDRLQTGPAEQPAARKKLTLELARLGVRLFSGRERVAWCGILTPFDLLHAMGVTSCFVEFVGAMLASSGTVEPLLSEAEEAGYAPDGCSYHRAVTGATLRGLMPVPDFLIATSAPCSGGLAVIENLARHFDRDLFVIHVPQDDGEAGVRFLAEQLRSMADFVTAHTGKPLEPERMRTAMANTNRARALLLEVYELARAVPSPARRRDFVNFGVVFALLLGSESAIDVARAYRDEFARSVASAANPGAEQARLLWLQNRIQFKNPLEELLEEDYQAAVVIDELNDVNWDPIDPDDPFPGLARRMLSIPLTGPVERRIRNLERLAREYQVDGAINPCHWGCRQGTGSRGLIEAGLTKAGIPVLNLEVDCVDPRSFSEGQLRTRLEAFMEMIIDRRA
ncbi:MAG: 2-hydroxyacyl-CoA dehydratase subunit D [Planctomycetota bacterium]|jgi:benzoyl-CoA reductase/2-hydroxyglutaryl-CoA dehydratase subunit BcrC/BadD/HgdB